MSARLVYFITNLVRTKDPLTPIQVCALPRKLADTLVTQMERILERSRKSSDLLGFPR